MITNVFSNKALSGEVVLVTGASRGIGRAILEAMAAAGATVVGTATRHEGAAVIDSHLRELGTRGRAAVLDVRDGAAAEALVTDITREYGKLSVLVNNAGITRDGLAVRMSEEDWNTVLETNLSAAFRLCRAVLRGMLKARHGRIINIGSVVAASGNAGQANYAAAKAGLEGMTRALAREVAARGICVNCVAPGFVATDMTRKLTEQQTQALLAQVPLGRMAQPAEIAAAVVFLASPAAAYITGATVHVNGGLFMN
ncbi:MAG: 3-oxoacyl-ACP reductase FabG [Sutterellaceae bacterium]|nr:3-oxoacyl-ACP reductase FabG [Burkholderiaceae bacterium]MCX7900954.1 3-oxoacyl-ACP reductase FabG [Burkholderiaceae bacterium]MDW8429821.1 3-oxoacyl-ACP reductase FabG [Sutterellaceae bacterium]